MRKRIKQRWAKKMVQIPNKVYIIFIMVAFFVGYQAAGLFSNEVAEKSPLGPAPYFSVTVDLSYESEGASPSIESILTFRTHVEPTPAYNGGEDMGYFAIAIPCNSFRKKPIIKSVSSNIETWVQSVEQREDKEDWYIIVDGRDALRAVPTGEIATIKIRVFHQKKLKGERYRHIANTRAGRTIITKGML